jgi:4a-hydroxytetrahydrobiopterin dehydratase
LAQDFVINVANLAKKLNHHPKITWDFKKVQIELSTHDKGTITSLDYKLATEIETLLNK